MTHALRPLSRLSGCAAGPLGGACPAALAVAVLLVLAAAPAHGATLHVCTTGNDATPKARNDARTPWATIGRAAWGSVNRAAPNAAEAAAAGDTVVICAGTYATAGTGDRSEPAYNPVNQGTRTQPIVFRADGVVTLTLSGSAGPVIGALGRDYIWWKGFTIHEATAPGVPDTGPVVFFSTTGSGVESCVIDGNGRQNTREPTNHTGVRIERSSQVTVRHNVLRNIDTIANVANAAGVQVYYSGNLVIEHNEIHGAGSGIFLKAAFNDPESPNISGPITIRFNLIHDSAYGIIVHRSPARAAAATRIYQNVIRGATTAGIRFWTFSPSGNAATEPTNAWVVNNTIVGSGIGIVIANEQLIPHAGHRVWNNIVADTATAAVSHAGPAATLTPDRIDFEHNVYHRARAMAQVGETRYTLSSWQSTFLQDASAAAATDRDPMFVDPGKMDFRLRPRSPALTLGVDMLDLNGDGRVTDAIPAGAYVTGTEVVGIAPARVVEGKKLQ